MKKLLTLGFALLLSIFSIHTQAQTIQNVSISSPILCNGDLATINIQLAQTSPPTLLKIVVGFEFFGSFIPITSTNNTTVSSVSVPGLGSQLYTVRLVDSVQYYATNPDGADPTSIYDFTTINITEPPPLTNSANLISGLDCYGDCDAQVTVNVNGGTPPHSVSFGGGVLTAGPSNLAFDSTYNNLCAGTYNISVTDANGCSVDFSSLPTSPTSITIIENNVLNPSASVTSNYNGQDISCFGVSDGEITASISGGVSPYTYSINGSPFTSNSVFTGLAAGTYTISYLDANGCDTSESITLTNPPNLSGAISISSQVSCFGSCDGVLDFQVNNILTGTSPYTYSLDGGPFQNSSSFSGLCGNTTYSITVRDANNCEYSTTKFLSEPTDVSFSYTTSDYNGFEISCNGFSDGEIIFNSPNGGQAPYTYSIDGSTFSNSMSYTGLSAGNYVISVQDANGCTSDTLVTLNEPQTFSLNYIVTNAISCPGICDGEIIVLPANGISPILYDLTGYSTQTSTNWTGLCGDITFGTYNLNATDDNGCTASTNITLSEPLPFVYTLDSITETCNLTNGQASISITQGGTPPYAYLWDDLSAQITNVASNLSTGLYEVRVTDANGCEFTEDIFVPEADITLSFDSIPPCNNGGDGSATVNPTGTPPYSILWETSETTNTISGLNPGFYSVTVSDATGCVVTDSVEVPASAIVTASVDVSSSTLSVLCNGYQSDTVTIIATGGTGIGTYQYYIPGVFPIPQYNNVFSGLYAGSYNVFVEDANGCTDFATITITEPDVIYYSAVSSNVSCNGGSDGSALVDSVSGGSAPYFYSWNTGQNTPVINNLPAGTYTVTVTDVNNCASNPQLISVDVNQPSMMVSNTNIISHSSCSGSQTAANGEAQVFVSGGTPGYSFAWSNGTSNDNISLLFPGTYIVDITDANGCMITDTAVINSGTNPSLNITVQDVSCFGANDGLMITSALSGTPPYLFSSDGGNSFVPLGTPFGPTGEASYFITVVDSEGCTDSDSIFVDEPEELLISSLSIQNVLCYDSANGQITANVSGGTGTYSYLWNNGQTSNPVINLIPSQYNVTVTDSLGCTVNSSDVNITQPDSLYISSIIATNVSCNGGSDGSVLVTSSGGTPNYTYTWSGGSDINLSAGSYTVTVTDNNGCTKSEDYLITEPSAISVQFLRDSVNCLGGSDGTATAIVTGGAGNYNLLWSDGSTSNTVNTLNAGYHTLTVSDANSCIFTDSVQILEPSQSIEIDSLIVSEITCNNANNASITVLATGGQLPYVYSNSNGVFTQNAISFINLSPNQYLIYVRDSRGCVDRDTVLITQPDSIYIDTTIFTHITCNGANDGQILSINAIGGSAPYLYSVNGGSYYSNMAYFHSYGPGTYTVQVVDNNNCSAQDIIVIEEPDILDVSVTTSSWNGYEIKCNGDNSGTATIVINGGNGPYIKTLYDANNSIFYNGTSNYITGISAGTYTLEIADANGCVYQELLIYQEPSAISHSFVTNNITCNGWTNGSITWNGSGGIGSSISYTYLWSTGDTTYSIDNLGVGNYTITVTDENNCSSTGDTTINNSSVLSSSIGSTQNPTCWNYCDGQISVNVSGGVPNINGSGNSMYNYQWNDVLSQTTQTAIGLCVDEITNNTVYTCVITDALGCTTTETYNLNQPEKFEISIIQSSNISCFGGNDGSLAVSTSGGNSGNVSYTWNTGQITSIVNNLSAATYVVVATDPLGCMDTTDYTITEPELLQANINSIDISDVLCYGESTGQVIVTVSGGSVNVNNQYSYSWIPNIGNPSSNYDFSTGIGNGILADIDTGIYQVVVTDVNNCVTTSNMVYVAQPTNPLSIFTDSIDKTCISDGSATAFVLGGTPTYSYLWTPGGQTSSTATNLMPNTVYSVEVTDANGCIIQDQTYINGHMNVFLPNNDDYLDSTICLGKSVFIEIEEKPNHSYVWTNVNDNVIIGTTASINVTPKDPITNYQLTITDEINCPLDPFSVEATFVVEKLDINPVATPNPLVLGDQTTITPSNIYSNFEWTWDNDTLTNTSSLQDYPETSTWYYVTATDNIGCEGIDSIYVIVGAVPYDAISPNGDGINDEWEILDIERYPNAEIKIFNRWGSLIYSSTGDNYNNNKWDGSSEGKSLPVGTYYYTINQNDGSDLQTGAVTIVR